MNFFANIPPLVVRVSSDPLARQILRTLADRAAKLDRAPRAYDVEQRIDTGGKSFETSLYALLNADLIHRSLPSGRLTLTRAGWELLGEQPPFWMGEAA